MDAGRRKAIHDALVRLSDGDRAAFDVLLDQLWPVIFSFAKRKLDQRADAEDIAQEVFFRICSRVADFDRTRDGLSWAFGIASYEIMTQRRRIQRRREVHDEVSVAVEVDGSLSQEQALLEREVKLAFEQALSALAEEDRQMLGLAPGREPFEIPSATFRKRKQRALERLRSLWRDLYGEP